MWWKAWNRPVVTTKMLIFIVLIRIRPLGIYGTDSKKYSHHRFRIGGFPVSNLSTKNWSHGDRVR